MNNTTGVAAPQVDFSQHDMALTDEFGSLRPDEKEFYSLEEFAQALFSEIDKVYADTGSGN